MAIIVGFLTMVQQCPNCLVLVGKLHMRCIACGIYFCEDCVDPRKHYCPSYKEKIKHNYATHNSRFSTSHYEKFASSDDLEESIQKLSVEEREKHNREHIIKANLIFQERLRLGIGNSPDQCPSCGSTINRVDEKCILCGIKFCVYCVKPEKHTCVIYQYEMEKYPIPIKSDKVAVKPVTVPAVVKKHEVVPETIAKPKEINEPTDESKILANPVKDLKEIRVTGEIKKKNPLWRRILSLFGFSN